MGNRPGDDGDDGLRDAGRETLSDRTPTAPGADGEAKTRAADSITAPAPQPLGPTSAETLTVASRTVGHFRLLRELGRGGQGSVHLAEDTRLHRQVALKLLDGLHAGFGSALERFRREAEITAKLDHPGICAIYEAGEDDSVPWIAMRHVEGEPLSTRIAASRASHGITADSETMSAVVQLPPSAEEAGPRTATAPAGPSSAPAPTRGTTRTDIARVCRFIEQAARAIHAAHEKGLIHRDIKPGNLMVTTGGDPVVLDFGLARETGSEQHTLTGTMLGTPAYMSPEQLLAQRIPLDARSDVWSLGVTLYECLTLRRPFDAPTRDVLYHLILSKEPENPRRLNPTIQGDLATVIQTALQKDRDRRYQTALELAEDLRRIREDRPIRAKPPSQSERFLRWCRHNPALAGSVSGLIVVLAVGLGVSWWLLGKADLARQDAELAREAERDRAAEATAATARERTARTLAEDAQRESDAAKLRVEAESAAKGEALRRARALGLAAASQAQLAGGQSMRALLLAREALNLAPEVVGCQQALRNALLGSPERAVLRGHEGAVLTSSFSPDGSKVVTASSDGTARIWAVTGGELTVLRGHTDWVLTAAFSPDGSKVVTASKDGTARVWEVAGKELSVLVGHDDWVVMASFSPDGSQIVTASKDATSRVWSSSGATLSVLRGHTSAVSTAVFSPDGSKIVTASNDATGRLWDTAGTELAVLRGHNGRVRSAAFAPDGSTIATTSDDQSARIWDLAGNEVLLLRGHEDWVIAAAFSPDGTRLVTASIDRTARAWALRVRDSSDKVLPATEIAVLRGHEGAVWALAMSPDGSRIATASGDGTVRVWGDDGSLKLILRGHSGAVRAASFSPVGSRIASAAADGTARVWDVAASEVAVVGGCGMPIARAVLSPDGSKLVTTFTPVSSSKDAAVGPVAVPSPPSPSATAGPSVRVPPSGGKAAEGAAAPRAGGASVGAVRLETTAMLWDSEGRRLAIFCGHEAPVLEVAISPDGSKVVSASEDKTARIWNLAGEQLAVLREPAERNVRTVAFSPDGSTVTMAGAEGTTTWDLSGNVVAVRRGADRTDRKPASSPDGTTFITRSKGPTAWIRDASGGELAVLRGHEGRILTAAFASDGSRLITSSEDGTARIWDLTGSELAVLRGHEDWVCGEMFSHDGATAVTWSLDGTARLWRVRAEDLLKVADSRITRDFTDEERRMYLGLRGQTSDEDQK